jgi:hypothetical protein
MIRVLAPDMGHLIRRVRVAFQGVTQCTNKAKLRGADPSFVAHMSKQMRLPSVALKHFNCDQSQYVLPRVCNKLQRVRLCVLEHAVIYCQ